MMAPAMPSFSCAFSAAISASEATPPEAITGMPTCAGKLGDRLGVDADQRAVAGDVGGDDRRDAGIVEAMRELDDADLAGLGPALDRDLAVARVDADDDAAGIILRRPPHQLGIAQRRGAEHHAVDAEIEPVLDRGAVADAAAELRSACRPRGGSPAPPRR